MKRKFIDKILLARPRLLLVLIAAITLLAAFLVKDLHFDASTGKLLPEESITVQTFDRFQNTFGHSEVLVVAFYDPGTVFTTENLQKIDQLTKQIDSLALVERVLSLTNLPTVRNRFGIPQLVTAYELFPASPEGLARFEAETTDLTDRLLASADKRVAAIYVHPVMETSGNPISRDVALVEDVERLLDGFEGQFYLVGSPRIKQALVEASKRDTVVAVAVTMVLVAIVLMFVFKDIWAVIVPLATYLLSLLWTGALMVLSGVTINSWTAIVAPLLLIISIADSVHILSTYRFSFSAGHSNREALRCALDENLTPCTLTTVTTMLGLLSLTLGKIPVMITFGIFAAAGVGIALLLSLTFVPSLLQVAPRISTRFRQPRENVTLSSPMLKALIFERPIWIVLGFIVCGAMFAVGAARVSVDTNYMHLFKQDHPLSRDSVFLEQHFGGTGPLEVIVQTNPGQLKTPEFLRAVELFQQRLEKLPEVDRTYSIVNLVKLANRFQHGGDPAQRVIPENQQEIDQLALLAELVGKQDQLSNLITPDFSQTRLLLRLHILGSTDLQRLIRHIEHDLSKTLPASATVQVTGTAAVFAAAADYLVDVQVNSFLGAGLTILLVVIIVFRSLRVGLFSAVPTLFPILAVFGLMGLSGIRLDFFNVMIASLVIGIAVDETIHFMARFREGIGAGLQVRQAILKSLREIETAVVSTSLILVLGFLSIALSASLNGSLRFGLLTAAAMFVALLSTLLGLPALLVLFWRTRNWQTIRQRLTGTSNNS